MARRRRTLSFLVKLFYVLDFLSVVFSVASLFIFSERSTNLCNSSFLAPVSSIFIATSRSDHFSSLPRRPFKISIASHRSNFCKLALCLITVGFHGRCSLVHRLLAGSLTPQTIQPVHEPEFLPDHLFLPRWYSSSSLMSALLPKPPVKLRSSPLVPRRLRSCIVDPDKRKLEFSVVGLGQTEPVSFSSWPIYEFGGPSEFSPKPRSTLCVILLSFDFLSRHNISSGRGLRSWVVSTRELWLLDISRCAFSSFLVWPRLVSISLVRSWISVLRILVQIRSQDFWLEFKRLMLLCSVPSISSGLWFVGLINPRQVDVSCFTSSSRLLCDVENLRLVNLHYVKNLLLQPSSSMERFVWSFPSFMEAIEPLWPLAVQSRICVAILTLSLSYAEEIVCLTPMRSKVLEPPSTSYGLTTSTIHHSPDLLADMVSTHHMLACDIELYRPCLRFMDLPSKYLITLSCAFSFALNLVVVSSIWVNPLNIVFLLIT